MNSFTKASGTSSQYRRSLRCGLIQRLRADSEKVGEPRARALLESTADALARLSEAFDVYRFHCETAWRLDSQPARLREDAPRP